MCLDRIQLGYSADQDVYSMEISRTMARMFERPDIDGSGTDSKTLAFDIGKQSRRISIGLVREYFGVMTKMRSNRAGGAGTDTPIFLGFEDDGVHLCQHPQRDSNDDDATRGQFITVPLDSGRSTSPIYSKGDSWSPATCGPEQGVRGRVRRA